MINKNYYPTPDKVIAQMINQDDFSSGDKYNLRLLEPSAGKGNILDYVKDEFSDYKMPEMFCIESDPELQSILRDKGYNLIDDDFLSYQSDILFDVIIMNPPFDNGTKHFLKAWEIGSDTHIECLLNVQTLVNPHTEERKLLKKIIADNGGTIKRMGTCFSDSERPTYVEVILVSIYKKAKSEYTFDFTKSFDQEKNYTIDDVNKNGIANIDVFANLETRFNKVKEVLKKMIETKNELHYYAQDLLGIDVWKLFSEAQAGDDKELFNNICDTTRADAWGRIFHSTKLGNVVTKGAREKIDSAQRQQGYMAFTAKNMENLYSDLFQNVGTIMNDCIVESFDLLTKYHKENRCHIEGWVTNKRFHVNQKFILPNSLDMFWIRNMDTPKPNMHYSRREEITDIEKSLCFISGKKFEDTYGVVDYMHNNQSELSFGKWYRTTFFEFKCFKKGTMHFKFIDKYLWDKFNIAACEGKNWLGN